MSWPLLLPRQLVGPCLAVTSRRQLLPLSHLLIGGRRLRLRLWLLLLLLR